MTLQSQIRPSVRNDDWGRGLTVHGSSHVAQYTDGEKRRLALLTELMILKWPAMVKAEGHSTPKRSDYSATRRRAFQAIKDNPKISVHEIAKITGDTTKAIDNTLQSMRKFGIIKRSGTKRDYRYTATTRDYAQAEMPNSNATHERRARMLEIMPQEVSINDAAALMGVSLDAAKEDLNAMRIAGLLVKKRVQHYSIYSKAETGESK